MMERNRQFGRASRPAESGALIAGRTYKKRVGAGRAKQAARAFAKLPTPASRPADGTPAGTEVALEAPPTALVSEALLDAVAVAIAEPVATDRTEPPRPPAEAPELTAAPPSEAGEARPEALEVRSPAPEERVETPRPAARPARKASVLLRIAVAASVAGAGLIGYTHVSGTRLFATTASLPAKAALPISAAGEARPSPVHATGQVLPPTEVTTLAPTALTVSGVGSDGLVEVAALAPTESITAHPLASAAKIDAPPAPAARVAAPKKLEKPAARLVAAAKPVTEALRAEPKPERRAEPSRGAILDFFSDVSDLIP